MTISLLHRGGGTMHTKEVAISTIQSNKQRR